MTVSGFICIFALGMFTWQQEKQKYDEKIIAVKVSVKTRNK